MKNGMNRIDIKDAHQLVMYGWTAAQISMQLKIKQHVVEAWMPQLTESGYAAYRERERKEREASTKAVAQLTNDEAVQLAKQQIMMEEKLRAEVRAELAQEALAKERAAVAESRLEKPLDAPEPEVAQTQVNAAEETEVVVDPDPAPAGADTERSQPAKSRRRRKAAGE